MSKNLKPQKGIITLNGEDIDKIPLKRFARELAIVHQHNTAPGDLKVEKLISYGRIAHANGLKRDRNEDERCINFALEATGIEKFRKKENSKPFRRRTPESMDSYGLGPEHQNPTFGRNDNLS